MSVSTPSSKDGKGAGLLLTADVGSVQAEADEHKARLHQGNMCR